MRSVISGLTDVTPRFSDNRINLVARTVISTTQQESGNLGVKIGIASSLTLLVMTTKCKDLSVTVH